MNALTTTPTFFDPKLEVGTNGSGVKNGFGYLQVNRNEEMFEIGEVDSPQYRLVRCLFSPSNFHAAKYNSVLQTLERVFHTLQGTSVTVQMQNTQPDPIEITHQMTLVVRRVIKLLEKQEVGKYLKFTWSAENVQMEVVPLAQ